MLQEPAIRIFTLMEHAVHFEAAEMQKQIVVAQIGSGNSDPDAVARLKAELERQQSDILELSGTENDYSAIKKLKKIMNTEDKQ